MFVAIKEILSGGQPLFALYYNGVDVARETDPQALLTLGCKMHNIECSLKNILKSVGLPHCQVNVQVIAKTLI